MGYLGFVGAPGPASGGGGGGGATGANPTATAGPTAINGVSASFLRSDGAPAVQLGTTSQPGLVQPDGSTITVTTSGVVSTPGGANPTATASDAAVNGSAATFMRSDGAPAIQKASSSQFGLVKVDGTTITAASGVISTGRQKLTSNTNYYVRSDGSDSNTGTANTAGGAWLTIQHAMDYLSSNIDGGGFGITVNIGSGTFAGVGMKDVPGALYVFLLGAGAGSTTIQDGPNDGTFNTKQCISLIVPITYKVFFDGVTLARSTGGTNQTTLLINVAASVKGTHPDGTATGWAITGFDTNNIGIGGEAPGAFFDDSGATITLSGSFFSVYQADALSVIWLFTSTAYTLSGTPSWNYAFARAVDGGLIETFGETFSGASTGSRYKSESGGIINTFGSGATYFPGNAGGSTDGVGVYL